MLYDQYPDGGGVDIDFEDANEVETVRSAFEEYTEHLLSLGNDASVSDYQKWVIRDWEGPEQHYRAGNHKQLADRLRYFFETTEERVGEIQAEGDNPDRITDSARRYELGHNAARLLESIELRAAIDAEWSEVIGE
jgi:hypothetical protein